MPFLSRPVLLGVVALLAFPISAGARERDVPGTGPLAAGVSADHGHLRDVVLPSEGTVMSAARARAHGAVYSSLDGYRIEIEVSASYPADRTADQALVDFLASRLHGPELGGLAVYVGTPREIERLCGGAGAVACYAVGEGRMYVPGEAVQGIPVEYPLTHEYGHHVASWRSNAPWDALDWGAKYWASAMRICTHVDEGLLFPGNQGAHYRDDPGEGFADGYAHLHYPDVPWHYNELMRPGPAEFEAIRRDVVNPWPGPRSRTFRGRLGPGRRTRHFWIPMTLDGDLTMRVSSRRGGTYTLQAESNSFAAGRVARAGHGLGIEWCRREPAERVKLTVRRRTGRGPFALTVRWPG